MNVKKTISVSFLLFVNIILLAHSAVCHHHDYDNQTLVVVCSTNQEHNCAQHTNNQTCHDTKNAHTCCVENCHLNDFFTPTNTVRFSKPIFNTIDIIIHNIPACQTIQITDLAGLPFRQKPYIPLFYTDFVAQSIGLRAPPVC